MDNKRCNFNLDRDAVNNIIRQFFDDMNPTLWDGTGEQPTTFDARPWQYALNSDVNLELIFTYDETAQAWFHFCDLTYAKDNSSFNMRRGVGIDSISNVTDTVLDLINNRL